MNRYFLSFVVAAIVYISTIVILIYTLAQPNYCSRKCKKINSKQISFSIVTQKPEPKTVQKCSPKPVTKKKIKPKPKPKKKPKPKPKPKPKAKPVEVPKKLEEIVQEEPKEKMLCDTCERCNNEETKDLPKQKTQEQTAQTQSSIVQEQIDSDLLLAKQNKFLAKLVERINSNKSYPHTARRRSIEGTVEIKFTILADGNVANIEILQGRRIFKRSAIQAIERSFPIEIDSTVFTFPKEFKIKISYILKR